MGSSRCDLHGNRLVLDDYKSSKRFSKDFMGHFDLRKRYCGRSRTHSAGHSSSGVRFGRPADREKEKNAEINQSQRVSETMFHGTHEQSQAASEMLPVTVSTATRRCPGLLDELMPGNAVYCRKTLHKGV